MQRKTVFYAEAAFVLGIIILAFGVAFMEKADFGMSMVVVPAYLIHLKVSQFLPLYTFGVSEYVFQAFLMLLLALLTRRFKKSYLLSFATAFVYGHVLDLTMIIVGLIPFEGLVWRIVCYAVGVLICAAGIALLFHTYLPTEVYELFVKEFAERFGIPIDRTKMVYDCCSCLIGIILSFCFFGFGSFVGVKWGTILCALINGWLIGRFSHLLDSFFVFRDALPWRNWFTK